MRNRSALTVLLLLIVAANAHAWSVMTKWIPGQFNGWYTWDSAGWVDESIILSPAQPDGNTYTNRIVTPAGTSSDAGLQIAGMSYDFSDEKEMWRQFYIYYPTSYTFHPIAEKIAGWHYTTNQTNNMQLVWFYDTFDWGTGNGWWDPPLGPPDYPENVPAKQKGHWYKFYERIKMNTVGQNNGIYQLWVDDKIVYDRSDVGYLHPTDSAANGFNHARQYLVWGGQGGGIVLGADMYSYYGTTVVSNAAIAYPSAPPPQLGALLTGMTPSSYTIPYGWSLVKAQDFEGTVNESMNGDVTTTRPHLGSKSLEGRYWGDGGNVAWFWSQSLGMTGEEYYVSFYDYWSDTARLNDELYVARFYQEEVPPQNAWHEIIADIFGGTAGENNGFNSRTAYPIIEPQGDGGYNSWWGPLTSYLTPGPIGNWVQWEIHFRPNTSGQSNGFMHVYRDGTLVQSVTNANLNGTVDMINYAVALQVGGTYTKLTWVTVPYLDPYTLPGDCATGLSGSDHGPRVSDFSSSCPCTNQCPPSGYVPTFDRFIDDIILMKATQGVDTYPPYASGYSPAKSATGVPQSTTAQTVTVGDSGVGVVSGTISISGPNGTETCSTGLTCSGTTASYNVTYPGLSLSYDQVTNWTLYAEDANGNALNDAWTWTVQSSSPSSLSITTSSLPDGTVGQSYSQPLAATGGATPYVWSLGNPPTTPPGAPYVGSDTIESVSWDFGNLITDAPGSDLWPMDWSDDNNVYTMWGDGGGFNTGTNVVCRTSTGLARIDGTPDTSLTYTAISGCKSTDEGCIETYTHDASCDAPYATPWAQGYTPDEIMTVGTRMWMMTTTWYSYPCGTQNIAYSDNHGQSWTIAGWNWDFCSDWYVSGWVHYGQAYAAGDATYVYVLGQDMNDSTDCYLARVPKAQLDNNAAYEWYTSTDPDSPTWGSISNKQPIFSDPTRQGLYWGVWGGSSFHMYYFPVLGRYVMFGMREYLDELVIYESVNPWGPFKTVYYNMNWNNYPQESPLTVNVVEKWTSADDLTFWITYSSSGIYDRWNLLKGTFTLVGGSLPTGTNMDSSGNITGVPTVAGTYNFTVTVSDAASNTDNVALSITVNPSTPAGGGTINISNIEDTFVRTSDPTLNYSTADYTRVNQYPAGSVANRIFYKIDLSSIPAGSTISDATLKLYMIGYDASGGSNPMRIYAYRITGTVPDIPTVTWNSFVGTLGNAITYTDVSLINGFVQFDITNAVQNAYGESETYAYIALDGGSGGAAETIRKFASKENATSSWYPVVTVTYTESGGGEPPPPTIHAPGKLRVSGGSFGFH